MHRGSHESAIADLLAALHAHPALLVVLNHPLWNARLDLGQRDDTLDAFVARYREFLHATEINGYRSPSENAAVVALGRVWDLPVLAGGDRHGRAPNAMLNLTNAGTFDEFVDEVRRDGRAATVVLPEYREHPTTRVLETVGDVLRRDEMLDAGRQRWTDRIFVILEDGAHVPLSTLWETGAPLWIQLSVGMAQVLGSERARRALRTTLVPEPGGVV